jgi:hypothetical protein
MEAMLRTIKLYLAGQFLPSHYHGGDSDARALLGESGTNPEGRYLDAYGFRY